MSELVKLSILPFLLIPPLHHRCGNQSCVTASDIMAEVNASAPDQKQEVGAVLGRVLYHALRGHCFISRSLPEESFFLDYIIDRLGSENFTVGGKCPAQMQIKKHGHKYMHRQNCRNNKHSNTQILVLIIDFLYLSKHLFIFYISFL